MFCLLSTICEHNPSHPQICAVPAWLALNRAVAALIAFLALSAHCGCASPPFPLASLVSLEEASDAVCICLLSTGPGRTRAVTGDGNQHQAW